MHKKYILLPSQVYTRPRPKTELFVWMAGTRQRLGTLLSLACVLHKIMEAVVTQHTIYGHMLGELPPDNGRLFVWMAGTRYIR